MRILWLKTELLHPVDKGGRIRSYQMLRRLKYDHRITYLSLDSGSSKEARKRASEYCHKLIRVPHAAPRKRQPAFYAALVRNLISPLPYAIQRYRSRAMRRAIQKAVEDEAPDLIVCDFLAPSINMPGRVPCPTLLFQHNVEAEIWRRHCEVARPGAKRAYFRSQWQRMRRYESDTCKRFDAVVAVSPSDRDLIRAAYGPGRVFCVPTGVDLDYFRPNSQDEAHSPNLVFTGSMDWLPNVDAIEFFASDVLPRIRRAVPDVRLTVVGRDPTPSLRRLARQDPAIALTGFVDDVRPYIRQASVYVVPLRIGGGTRLKIYEALAMERAVVSTSIGAEGLPLNAGEELLIADGPERFADEVVGLLEDPAAARNLAERGAARVRSEFGWDRVTEAFSRICTLLVRGEKAMKETEPVPVSSGEVGGASR